MPYDSPSVPPEMKARLDALKNSMSSPVGYRVENYPADVAEILTVFCELWNFRAPAAKNRKGFWIESGRELLDACGEFGVECLKKYREDFVTYMKANNGLAPHTVASPKSLVNMVAAKAAEMRNPKVEYLSAEAQREIRARERMERERNA